MPNDQEAFNYQETYGVRIRKLKYKKTSLYYEHLQYTHLTIAQKEKIDGFVVSEYKMTDGYRISGKVFSDPKDNSTGRYVDETNVIMMTKVGEKGAAVMLPNGEVHWVSRKSWKPTVEHFKV